MNNCFTVYKHTSPSNKVYIGITSQPVQRRWRNGNGYIKNQYFYRAIKKYGWDNFLHEILYENISQREAEEIEISLIKEYDSANSKYGYNIDLGGSYAGKMSEKTKQKISKAHKGKVHSDEAKRKMSIARKGENNSFFGRTHTEETKKLIGYKNSQKSWKDKFGVDHNKSIGVFCIETNTFYGSSREAEHHTGIDHSSISRCCRQLQNTAGGYHWMYNNDYIKSDVDEIDRVIEKDSSKTLKVVCLNNNQIFESSKEASMWCNLKQASSIRNCCIGLSKTSGVHPVTGEKLRWQYLKDFAS